MRVALVAVGLLAMACGSTAPKGLFNEPSRTDSGSGGQSSSETGSVSGGSSGTGGTGAIATGCTTDFDCKGSRVCAQGQCMDPGNASGGASGFGGGGSSGQAGANPSGGDSSAGGHQSGGGASAGGSSGSSGAGGGSAGVTRDGGSTEAGDGSLHHYNPVALYIMIDRSGSMITGFPTGSSQSWANTSSAVQEFTASSRGIDVGIGFFPSITGSTSCATGDDCCNGNQCYIPAVDIGPSGQAAPAIAAALNIDAPSPVNLTPTECAINGMVRQCEDYAKNASEACIAVLITDGSPTQCDSNVDNLKTIVAGGFAKGVKTFVLGLTGADPAFLDPLAAAGGTGKSIDVSSGESSVLQALRSIP